MKLATKIILQCGVLATAGAIQAAVLAGEVPSTSRIGLPRLLNVPSVPAASTEEFHAPEGTSILPLLNDYEAFVVRLLLTKGHLRAGIEAYESGNDNQALAHLGQPVEVLHDNLDRWVGTPGAEPFEAALGALVAAVHAKAPIDAVTQDLAMALRTLDGAIEKLDVDIRESPTFTMLVTLAVLRAAADEYDLGVSGGRIVDIIEYQDARAFMLEARACAESASGDLMAKNSGAYGILIAEFAALEMALPPAAQFPGTRTTTADLRRAVVRVGLLYDSFK